MSRGRHMLASMLLAAVPTMLPAGQAQAGQLFDEATLRFAAQLDLTDWELLPSLHRGRLEIVDTLARRQLRAFHGGDAIDGASPTFSLLEVYFNAGAYLGRPIVRIRDDRLRSRLGPKLTAAAARAGRIAPIDLLDAGVKKLLEDSGRAGPEDFDAQRLGSLRGEIQAAARIDQRTHAAAVRLLGEAEAFLVAYGLKIIPASDGGRYLALEEVAMAASGGDRPAGLTGSEAAELNTRMVELARAWQRREAQSVNELSRDLLGQLATRGRQTYPPLSRRRLERLYNQLWGFTIAWAGYLVAAVLLLGAAATGGRRGLLRAAGVAAGAASTAFLAAGMAVRWHISGRGWKLPPLTNQYESVLGMALMAGIAGLVLELIFRKGWLALAASVVAAVALLCAFLQLGPLQGEIAAPQAVLNTPVLAWHVATLMVAYGAIAMSLLVSVAYLAIAFVRCGADSPRQLSPSAGADLTAPPPARGNVLAELDRCNLVLLQLACWLVAVGVVLGAYWADLAWGRWWGWDVKETWGLMTLLVYLGIVHARVALPDRTRGKWTAVLAIVGSVIMAFTWWGVNMWLAGLHGYA